MISNKVQTMRSALLGFALVAMMVPFAVSAQETGHAGHADHGAAAAEDIYAPAMRAMHKGMMVKPTGDADVDFVRGMIPHHQGAIDMAKIVLEHGKDPEIKKLAEEVIRAQEGEIAFMEAWLKKHGQ
jgi:uncharacterized protein (DUF305 family)